jgi:hypothetical protein
MNEWAGGVDALRSTTAKIDPGREEALRFEAGMGIIKSANEENERGKRGNEAKWEEDIGWSKDKDGSAGGKTAQRRESCVRLVILFGSSRKTRLGW